MLGVRRQGKLQAFVLLCSGFRLKGNTESLCLEVEVNVRYDKT
jgi:hypothetical protein